MSVPSHLSRIFRVAKSNGTFRLILAWAHSTSTSGQEIRDDKSLDCCETYTDTSLVFNSHIMDAFLHLRIRPCLQKYLAFSNRCQLHFAQSIPFGLCTAPMVAIGQSNKVPTGSSSCSSNTVPCIPRQLGNLVFPWPSQPSNKGRHNHAREVENHHQSRKIVTNSKLNSSWLWVEWHGDLGQWNIRLYSPSKTTRNNVFSPKPPLFKTNDKTTLGGICGSSELCLPDSQVSQPHYAITIKNTSLFATLRNALHP